MAGVQADLACNFVYKLAPDRVLRMRNVPITDTCKTEPLNILQTYTIPRGVYFSSPRPELNREA